MWNQDLFKLIKSLSAKYPKVLFILQGRDEYTGMPVDTYCTVPDDEALTDIKTSYENFVASHFPEVLQEPEEYHRFTTFMIPLYNSKEVTISLTYEVAFALGGNICG